MDHIEKVMNLFLMRESIICEISHLILCELGIFLWSKHISHTNLGEEIPMLIGQEISSSFSFALFIFQSSTNSTSELALSPILL